MPPNWYKPIETVDLQTVESLLHTWPLPVSLVAHQLVKKYGLPHEATRAYLVWYYNDPWERTMLWREGLKHTFPKPHADILEQTIVYTVPSDRLAEVQAYNSHLIINRTRGQMTSICNSEATNFLVMNLAHEIALGAISAKEAQRRHREILAGHRLHWPESYMEGLQFEIVPTTYGVNESNDTPVPVPQLFR